MAPPTGASVDPYCGDLEARFQNFPLEPNDSRIQKTWGDKWNMARFGKVPTLENHRTIESSNFVVHPDYLHKYGTLSNGALTKGIKYAETWLYGTVGVRSARCTQRPSLFLYPGAVHPPPRIVNRSNYPSSPGAIFGLPVPNGSSSERNGYVIPPFSRKHAEQCFDDNQLRLYQCGSSNVQSETCPPIKKSGEKKNATWRGPTLSKSGSRSSLRDSVSGRDKSTASSISDPYNLMRKNRLGSIEITEPSIFSPELRSRSKKRNASVSPTRTRETRTPSSFDSLKSTLSEKEIKLWKNQNEDWIREEEEEAEEVTRRKSILECEVNAYELNKSKSKDEDDFGEELTLSDDLTKKLKIIRPKFNKTDHRVASQSGQIEVKDEKSQVGNPRSSLQRYKMFDRSNLSTSHAVEEWVSDEEGHGGGALAKPPVSPKRPPRRPKEKSSEESGFKLSKSKSKSSPNLSIKSILKKRTDSDEVVSLLNFEGEITPSISSASAAVHPEKTRSKQFGQSGKNQVQSTLKKKKQVQFKVNNSNEFLNEVSPTSTDSANPDESAGSEERNRHQKDESMVLSEVTSIDCSSGKSNQVTECDVARMAAANVEKRSSRSQEKTHEQSESKLKRSNSDRRFAPDLNLHNNDSHTRSGTPQNLFNDTMALRTRGVKVDAREVFHKKSESVQSDRHSESKKRSQNLNGEKSAIFSRSIVHQEEPAKKLSGNIISYAEFTKLSETPGGKKQILSPKTTPVKKSKAPMKSHVPTKTKSPAPSPPLRESPNEKSPSAAGTVSLRVTVKESKKETIQPSPITGIVSVDSDKTPVKAESPKKAMPSLTAADKRTVVKLSPSLEEELKTEENCVAADKKRASIIIYPKNMVEKSMEEPRQRKTSVVMTSFHPRDSNKVTINVRNEPSETEMNSSSCTIIETGSNSTVIPVVSTDNKTTLIVGSNTSSPKIEINGIEPPSNHSFDSSYFPSRLGNTSKCTDKPSRYIFSTVDSEPDKGIESLDPVEVVRRNLIPHICGKDAGDSGAVGKVVEGKEKESESRMGLKPEKAEKGEEIPAVAVAPSSESPISSMILLQNVDTSGEPSTVAPRDGSSIDVTPGGSEKNPKVNAIRSESFSRKSLETDGDLEEKDKLECEYEIRNGIKVNETEDGENIYEVVREEPIYDQIESKESVKDVPPPLPLTLPPTLDGESEKQRSTTKSIFEGASKYEILNYLVDAKERVQEDSYLSGNLMVEDAESKRSSSSEGSERTSFSGDGVNSRTPINFAKISTAMDSDLDSSGKISLLSYSSEDNLMISTLPEKDSSKSGTKKSSVEIERNDSGVGSETSHASRSKWQISSSVRKDPQHLCEDCDDIVETQVTDGGVRYVPLACRKCAKKRSERKEIIQEIVETEEKYGRDLKIILEEFYTPMLVAGLLTSDQLSSIFLNTEELLEHSRFLTERLRDALEIALEQGDEDLLTVNVGKLFLESEAMLHAFESYCTRQGAAACLLTNLEKEKELLRIFLRVSQMENAVLRRMNLNSFLMVPVQRVTKYPLLLARLYKVTLPQQEGRELLREAQHNIELHLEHMNSEAKDVTTTKVWRRFSTSTVGGRKSATEMTNIKLRKMAVDALEWNHEEVRFVLEGKLLYTQPTESNWKRGRSIKLTPVFVLLVTLGKPNSKYKVDPGEEELTFPSKTGIREATLLLVKEKCGRYTLTREPLYLDKIIVCCETDIDEYFEVQELSTKDSFLFKAADGEKTKEWYKQLQYHAQILGSWRKRRNALANIMINGMMTRTCTG